MQRQEEIVFDDLEKRLAASNAQQAQVQMTVLQTGIAIYAQLAAALFTDAAGRDVPVRPEDLRQAAKAAAQAAPFYGEALGMLKVNAVEKGGEDGEV